MLWHKCQPDAIFFLITSCQHCLELNQNDFVDQRQQENFLAKRFSGQISRVKVKVQNKHSQWGKMPLHDYNCQRTERSDTAIRFKQKHDSKGCHHTAIPHFRHSYGSRHIRKVTNYLEVLTNVCHFWFFFFDTTKQPNQITNIIMSPMITRITPPLP